MISDHRLKNIVIVGGGTAGWMTAAALCHRFKGNKFTNITLVESDSIGSVGVGEATVPAIREFLSKLGISESDFIKRTNATFKLGIEFRDWAGKGSSFLHPFADHGLPIAGTSFMAAWTKLAQNGDARPIDDFNLGSQLANHGRFSLPKKNDAAGNSLFNYAFHFDAILGAQYFRAWSEMGGVKRQEGLVKQVIQNTETGHVTSLTLSNGLEITGDLFIDCSGFRGLLIEETLEAGFEDWTKWLRCDRAVTVATKALEELPSSTRALARPAGWQWRIPLQNRTGNGYVYCSDYISEDQALQDLKSQLSSPVQSAPKVLKFKTGVRKKIWDKNVYAIGLSAGFLEPLESTGIYLIQIGISLLLSNFPTTVPNPALIDEINRGHKDHWIRVRDFIIMHYALNQRGGGEPLWAHCRDMALPDALVNNIELYKRTGRLRLEHGDFFQRSSWVSMFCGFGIIPERYHPKVDDFPYEALQTELSAMSNSMEQAAGASPTHLDFIRKNCASAQLAL